MPWHLRQNQHQTPGGRGCCQCRARGAAGHPWEMSPSSLSQQTFQIAIKLFSPVSQGPGPSNNVFLKGNESVFNLALFGRYAPRWLPEASLGCLLPVCGCLPLWESDRPCSMVQAPLLSSSSSGNPLSYLNYHSSLVSAKKLRDL